MSSVNLSKKMYDTIQIDLASAYQLHNNLLDALDDAEEKAVKQVLQQLLKRDPTEEDIKDCQAVYQTPVSRSYTLCYKNIPLGIINKGDNLSVTFTPVGG
jgi:hypothetical protein